jgi:lysosomal acid lipase/cholesteryl ester hydrolase
MMVPDDGRHNDQSLFVHVPAGYPLELHCVTTADGYVLRMERIPRAGCSRVAFFLHGILDTSLTWVSSGVTGSQAFAAWDQGFDVWLGSSRSNPPRIATGAGV